MTKRNPWLTLTVLAIAQFVVVLDLTIVNVALPHIQHSLTFSNSGLQWVVSAYTLLFGGFLLLGGRAADLLGRRAVFMSGLVLFVVASFLAGLAQDSTMLIVARGIQGLGGAMLSPAALSLLTVTFSQGRDRNVAMGIWGSLAGLGGTAGVVVGGVLVQALSWRWVFFVNVPIGIALVLLTPRFVAESKIRGARGGVRGFDVPGALLGTGGLLSLVFAIVRTQVLGWGSTEVIVFLAVGIALLAAFAVVEGRAVNPLVPMRLYRPLGMRTSSLAVALNGVIFLGMFYLTSIFLQEARGLSALGTGIEILPMGVAAVIAAVVSSQLVTRVGTRPVQIGGSILSVVGLFLLSRAGLNDPYVTALLPGFVLFGLGLIAIFVPAQITAVADVAHDDAGAASAIITAANQVGGALGLAIITTVSNSHVTALVHSGVSQHLALTAGFQRGLLIAAGFAAVNLLVSVASPRLKPDAEMVAAAAAAA